MEASMKALVTAAALLALLTTSAIAQKNAARSAYAQARTAPSAPMVDTMNGPNGQIIWGGSVRGMDPDPSIRAGMGRGYGNMGGT
jgi:hypothetical protein